MGPACLLALGGGLLACGGEATPEAPFPEGYAQVWREAREPCRLSHDHALRYIRVYADDAAYAPYTAFDAPYPPGARLLKVEYRDAACEERLGYVMMRKLPAGSDPEAHDWEWLRFDAERAPIHDADRIPDECVGCHAWHCAEPPYGWDLTCSGVEPGGPGGAGAS